MLIAKEASFQLLPFRFLRIDDHSSESILLTAETGEYLFVSERQLHDLVYKVLDQDSSHYRTSSLATLSSSLTDTTLFLRWQLNTAVVKVLSSTVLRCTSLS